MFAKILQWLREVWSKMISGTDLKSKLKVDISMSGYMINALQLWTRMYVNQAAWLSEPNNIVSMNLPAAIAGEISRAVTIEMQVKIEGDNPRAKFLNEQFAPVMEKLRQQVEFGCAKGGLMFKPYVRDGKIAVDYIQADQFFPVTFDTDGKITACVFADQLQKGQTFYHRLEFHRMTSKGCEVKNMAFMSSDKTTLGSEISLQTVDEWKDIAPQAIITGIDKPLFAYFRYPQANNIDPTSPLGVSCYSRAVDLIQQADLQWSSLLWEFDSGKRALYVDELAFDQDKNGKPILPNKRLYRTLKGVTDVGKEEMFKEWSPDFRETSILAGLEAILRKIEFTCGLAYGTLSNPQTIDKTATELKISQQRSYATVSDTQKALQNALDQLIWAMDIWVTLEQLAPEGDWSTVYDFDDSVVVDKDTQFQQDLRLVTTNIMSPIEFRMRNFGEDEKTAAKMIAAATPVQPQDQFGQGNGGGNQGGK